MSYFTADITITVTEDTATLLALDTDRIARTLGVHAWLLDPEDNPAQGDLVSRLLLGYSTGEELTVTTGPDGATTYAIDLELDVWEAGLVAVLRLLRASGATVSADIVEHTPRDW